MKLFIKAFLAMIWEFLKERFNNIYNFFMDGNFFDDPSRGFFILFITWLFVYYSFIAKLDVCHCGDNQINYFLIPILAGIIGAMTGACLLVLANYIFLNMTREFKNQLRKQRELESKKTNTLRIEDISLQKTFWMKAVDKIKRRVPEKPNPRLESVE